METENRNRHRRLGILMIIVVMLAAIWATRLVALRHNISLHPDESVFYTSSANLLDSLSAMDLSQYEPVKTYPEGAFVFQLPFQALARHIQLDPAGELNLQLWGRIGAVFYFALGCLFGILVLYDGMKGGLASAIIYACIMVFALFHIEQSRYGTFDPISFFLQMLVVLLLIRYCRHKKWILLLLAACCVGVMGAGKYPLLVFFALPFFTELLQPNKKLIKKIGNIGLSLAACIFGFLLFSPGVVRSPAFFIQTCQIELVAYALYGNIFHYGTPVDNFLSLLTYNLLYSDFPLSLVFAVYGVVRMRKEEARSPERTFVSLILPLFAAAFALYNVLIKSMFMRTFYPFFCFSALYAAYGLGNLPKKTCLRGLAAALGILMVLRGGYFIYTLSPSSDDRYSAKALLASVPQEHIRETVHVGEWFFLPEYNALEPAVTFVSSDFYNGRFPDLEEGQLHITTTLDHNMACRHLGPVHDESVLSMLSAWAAYKKTNEAYYVGKVYPEAFYWLFGFWVHGTTGTGYEFPTNELFYNPPDDHTSP